MPRPFIKSELLLVGEALQQDRNGDGQPDGLVLGHADRSFTLAPGAEDCLPQWLPATGRSAVAINPGHHMLSADCQHDASRRGQFGELGNPLLGEALKLNVRVRLQPELGKVKLSTLSCDMTPQVEHALGRDPDLNKLIELSNRALGGDILRAQLNDLLPVLRCANERVSGEYNALRRYFGRRAKTTHHSPLTTHIITDHSPPHSLPHAQRTGRLPTR